MQQLQQAFAADQRHIAVQHEHPRRVGNRRHRLLHGMSGAQLLALRGPLQIALIGKGGLHLIAAVPVHDMDRRRLQLPRGGDHVRQHRLARQRLQHFGQGRAHALALARGQDHNVQGQSHQDIPGI